ncbi:hypothetical protein CerSpe_048840 [Prunus speciosa]
MQDKSAAVEEEKPSSLAKKLLNYWNTWRAMRINSTENRSVLHVALHATRDAVIQSDGKNVVPDVWEALDKIQKFSESIRSGFWVGATRKALKDVIAVGIGGSFLGPLQTGLEDAFHFVNL